MPGLYIVGVGVIGRVPLPVLHRHVHGHITAIVGSQCTGPIPVIFVQQRLHMLGGDERLHLRVVHVILGRVAILRQIWRRRVGHHLPHTNSTHRGDSLVIVIGLLAKHPAHNRLVLNREPAVSQDSIRDLLVGPGELLLHLRTNAVVEVGHISEGLFHHFAGASRTVHDLAVADVGTYVCIGALRKVSVSVLKEHQITRLKILGLFDHLPNIFAVQAVGIPRSLGHVLGLLPVQRLLAGP